MSDFKIWDTVSKKMVGWEDISRLPARDLFSGSPKTIYCVIRPTGKYDISGKEVYEGDIIESHISGGLIIDGNMEIKYGTYQSYCPVDKSYMDSVGFYVAAKGYQDMPVGPLEDYAKVIGNIFENPELIG